MSEIRHPYKPKALIFILTILFFGVCSVILAIIASTNTQELVITHLIELSAKNASIFYWCLAVASIFFVMIAALGIYSALTSKNEIILTNIGFAVPKRPTSNKIVTINYSDITHVAPITVHGQNMLIIQHEGGNVSIQQSAMPNEQIYNQVMEMILERATL